MRLPSFIKLPHNRKFKLSPRHYDPIKDEMFYAEKNNGAYFNNHRIRVSKKNNLDECLFGSNLNGVKNINLNLNCLKIFKSTIPFL